MQRWREDAAAARKRGKKSKGHILAERAAKFQQRKLSREAIMHCLKGDELRSSFETNIPALKDFQDAMKAQHKEQGYLVGLDGRHIPTRSAHSAPNFRLQSNGALLCKLWGVIIERKCQEAGLKHGRGLDYMCSAWVHDEYQIAVRNVEIAKQIGAIAQEAIVEAGEAFNFSCPLDADFSIGKNWAETH